MGATKLQKYTIEEYLKLEESSGVKHEFYDGEVFAMSGGTLNHSLIANNVGRTLGNVFNSKWKELQCFK